MSEKGNIKSDDGTHCAFFYGTLMAPEVFFTVCYQSDRVPAAIAALHTFQPAILHGFSRRRVRHADYPGITADAVHKVRGTFATGLTRANMDKLDYFEGAEYERRTVKVKLLTKVGTGPDGEGNEEGEEREAQVYVFMDKKWLEDREWDFEEFRREKMQLWTRAGYAFEGCDPDTPAIVAEK